ncbi:hypothetical protein BGZ63DRAFT_347252 [Mariannaea sp. PMI_226]|nr:hypothetical protein BGZ63DRAFT_347252 [Mariannaea sp. PMI_226]
MDKPKSPRYPRHVTVGKCHVQTATDRFGDGAKDAIRAREPDGFTVTNVPEIPFDWPDVSSDGENRESIFKKIPSMQPHRNNLTALSQVHNLYFVAYQSRIFVYRPRAVPSQRLPSRPDLQLKSRPDWLARHIGGMLDISRPHIINNVMTGFLGTEEIVLACYDDGHVVAYYVKGIANWVSAQHGIIGREPSPRLPAPFFQENVGLSAWGLAIHQRSRLIAVSSNRHEVTIFAFGLSQSPFSHNSSDLPEDIVRRRDRDWRIMVTMARGVDNMPNICFIDDEHGLADKVCAIDIKGCIWICDIWKSHQAPICIGPLKHNHLTSEEFFPSPSRGWGIFPLAEKSFIQVDTKEELFGLSPYQVDYIRTDMPGFGYRPIANVRKVLTQIEGNPCPWASVSTALSYQPPQIPLNTIAADAFFPQLLISDDEDDEEGVGNLSVLATGSTQGQATTEEESGDQDDNVTETDEEGQDDGNQEDEDEGSNGGGGNHWLNFDLEQLDNPALPSISEALDEMWSDASTDGPDYQGLHNLSYYSLREVNDRPEDFPAGMGSHIYFPGSGVIQKLPESRTGMLAFLRRPFEHHPLPARDDHCMGDFKNRLHLLRTYEKDIEMRGFSRPGKKVREEVGVVCPDALRFGLFNQERFHRLFQTTSRLNMIAHAPELGLVAIGSATGRVLLLTLTRMRTPVDTPQGAWHHGFRVERILPTKEDEDRHRKYLRPLHGMAMGPMQGDSGSSAAFPRKYRLMLHYRNHDIVSYEISRDESMGRLCIF